jgi:hypothetical protein
MRKILQYKKEKKEIMDGSKRVGKENWMQDMKSNGSASWSEGLGRRHRKDRQCGVTSIRQIFSFSYVL